MVLWGFVINPYDWCVANKTIDGKQCTILWHVDDLKISHKEAKVTESILDLLNDRYGKETPLTVTRGDIHEYLGMTIDYSTDGKVVIRMEDYVEEMLQDLPEDMAGSATTPAAEHLFQVNEDAEALSSEDSDLFHSVTAKLLLPRKRARPVVQTHVAFIGTRVMSPDVDDYKKLRTRISHQRGTTQA